MSYVYKISHPSSGIFYIGCTNDVKRREAYHRHLLRYNNHSNKRLQDAYNKNNEINFTFTETPDIETAYDLEYKTLLECSSDPCMVNIAIHKNIGNNIPSKEVNQQRSERMKNQLVSDLTKERMSITRTGVPKTEEWSNKIAESVRKKVSIEGTVYTSMTEAARALGLELHVVSYRVKESITKYPNWFKV